MGQVLHDRANTKAASAFLAAPVEVVSYKIHTVLTDNGIQFADLPKNRKEPTAILRGHPFDRACGRRARLSRVNFLRRPASRA